MNIAAGVRWLFRKREVAKTQLGHQPTWLETVFSYKGYLNSKTREAKKQMARISKLYEELKK